MKPISGTTKTGFSKAGFSCCSFWNQCNMGKDTCYYDVNDPEVKEYCRCYIRNHAKKKEDNDFKQKSVVQTVETLDLFSSAGSNEVNEASKDEDDFTQLTLF